MINKFIVFDTETTGLKVVPKSSLNLPCSALNRGAEVVQIGGIIFDGSTLEPSNLFCYYCDAVTAECERGAMQVNKLSLRNIRKTLSCRFLPEIMTTFLPDFFEEDVCLIGYNVGFDISMVDQSLSNSSLKWNFDKPLTSNTLPSKGPCVVDVMPFVSYNGKYRKLSSFDNELKSRRDAFLAKYIGTLGINTNDITTLQGQINEAHNSFYDSLNTYILWCDYVWKKKMF